MADDDGKELEAAAAALAARKRAEQLAFVLVRIVDSRPPFPVLALLKLAALPRPGDLILIETSLGRRNYRVQFVNFDPFLEFQVQLGCLPVEEQTPASETSDASLKERMENVVKWQLQVFERGQMYSNTIVVAGYAGIFGIWSFARPSLTSVTTDLVVLLIGVSLFIYISWTLFEMIVRANATHRFARLISKQPTEVFQLFGENMKTDQIITARMAKLWKPVVASAGFLAFAAGLILLVNVFANLVGWRQWP